MAQCKNHLPATGSPGNSAENYTDPCKNAVACGRISAENYMRWCKKHKAIQLAD